MRQLSIPEKHGKFLPPPNAFFGGKYDLECNFVDNKNNKVFGALQLCHMPQVSHSLFFSLCDHEHYTHCLSLSRHCLIGLLMSTRLYINKGR